MPKLSVLIPTYNRAHFLPEAVDSVLGQTFGDLELIVVDNASSDNTPEIMELYVSRDPRVKYIRKSVNKGVLDSFRLGLQHSSGEYQAFLDSDDTMLPTRIEKQMKILDQRSDISMVFTGYYFIDVNGRRLRKSPAYQDGNYLKQLLFSCFIQWNTIVVRRSVLDTVGPFDESLSHSWDWDWLLRMLISGYQCAGIPEPLNTYRMHPGNLTRNTASEELALNAIIRKTFADPRLPESLRALQNRAIAATSLWLASGYYRSGQWDDARRNLAMAWRLTPEWHDNRKLCVNALQGNALNPWVFDPVEFMQNVLDHLPQEMLWLEGQRKSLLAAAHIGAAFRHLNLGESDQFQQHMLDALEQYPDLLAYPETFIEYLLDEAAHTPMPSAELFVNSVLNHLPPQLNALRSLRGRALGAMNIVYAFKECMASKHSQVPRHVLAAARYRPSLLANRGVMSILVRSLVANLFRK